MELLILIAITLWSLFWVSMLIADLRADSFLRPCLPKMRKWWVLIVAIILLPWLFV